MIEFLSSHLEIIIRGLSIFACGIMWRMGGSDELPKLVRRLGCALIVPLPSCLFGFKWYFLLSIPLLFGAFSMGYGINSSLTKLLKNKYLVRFTCGLLYSVAAIPLLWGNWIALGFHIILTSTFVMLAGNQKFQYSDKREEFAIGSITDLMPTL